MVIRKFNVNYKLLEKELQRICLVTRRLKRRNSEEFSRFWVFQGISITLDNNDTASFTRIVNELWSKEFIRSSFAKKDIEKNIQHIISRVVKKTKKHRKQAISDELRNLQYEIHKEIKDWIITVPLDNVTIKPKYFRIGNVKLINFNKYQQKKWNGYYRTIISANPNYTSIQKRRHLNLVKTDVKRNSDRVCAELKITASASKAIDIAIKEINTALNILRLYTYHNDDSYRRYYGIQGEVIPSQVRTIMNVSLDKKYMNLNQQKVGYFFPFELDKDRIKFMKKNGYYDLIKVFTKMKKTDLDIRLLTSVYWFGKAACVPNITTREQILTNLPKTPRIFKHLEYFNAADRFLKLMIALEGLLLFNEDEKITNSIAERVSILLADKYVERRVIKKQMKYLYRMRSKIVHSGDTEISNHDLRYLMTVVQSVIINILKRRKRLKIRTLDDLSLWFEKKCLS